MLFFFDRFHSYCRLCCWHYHKDWMQYFLAGVFQSRQLGHLILHKTENNQLIVVIHHLHLYLQLHFYLYENRHLYFGHVRLEILYCTELKAINSQSLKWQNTKCCVSNNRKQWTLYLLGNNGTAMCSQKIDFRFGRGQEKHVTTSPINATT